MKIYNIYRDDADYEEYEEFVVAANDESEVIELVKQKDGRFAEVWENATIDKVGIYTGESEVPFIITEVC